MVDEKTYNNLKTDLINPQNLVKLLCLILGVGLGSAMIILSIVSCFVNICYFTKVSLKYIVLSVVIIWYEIGVYSSVA
jgi:hypothetical protein